VERWTPPPRRPSLELVTIDGEPTEAQRAAIERALQHVAAREQNARTPSMWLRAGRATGRRLGAHDYRDRIASEDAWRMSVRLPSGGRDYAGRQGRGDSR